MMGRYILNPTENSMPKGQPSNFRIIPLLGDHDSPTAVYARVYEAENRVEIVGRNVKLNIKQAAYGRGKTERWSFGDNWKVKPMPWEASAGEAGGTFAPEEGE